MEFTEHPCRIILCFPSGYIVLQPYIDCTVFMKHLFIALNTVIVKLVLCEAHPSDDLFSYALRTVLKKMLQLVHFLLSQFQEHCKRCSLNLVLVQNI